MSDTLQEHFTNPKSGIEKEIAALSPWFHNIHLPDGHQTCPHHQLGDFPAFKWKQISPLLPERLDGWRVLDIGCNAGFYTFELAKRGAVVEAVDVDPHYLRQAEWAAGKLGLEKQVSFRQAQVYDFINSDESYDLVWFMGVFYHLRYPLLALDAFARLAKRLFVFQTLTLPGERNTDVPQDLPFDERERMSKPDWPKMAFIEERLAGDPTNWWAASDGAVRAMLKTAGLVIEDDSIHETYICRPATEEEANNEKRELAEREFQHLSRALDRQD